MEIKNDPLRLVLSDKERVLIRQDLRASKRQCFAWVMVFALSVGAVLGGANRYGEVPYEVQIDRVLAAIERETSENMGACECPGNFHIYLGTQRRIWFCDDDPQHTKFRAHLETVVEEQGWWPVVNFLLVLVGFLAFFPSLILVAEALFAIRKYVKYGDDLDAFLRRFNRAV